MKFILDQNEIETALKNYTNTLINLSTNATISIELKATRGDNGYTATVDVNTGPVAEVPVEAPVKPIQKNRIAAIPVAKVAVEEPAQDSPEDVQEELPLEEAISVEEIAEELQEEAPKPKKKSIFAAVTKPVNAAAED